MAGRNLAEGAGCEVQWVVPWRVAATASARKECEAAGRRARACCRKGRGRRRAPAGARRRKPGDAGVAAAQQACPAVRRRACLRAPGKCQAAIKASSSGMCNDPRNRWSLQSTHPPAWLQGSHCSANGAVNTQPPRPPRASPVLLGGSSGQATRGVASGRHGNRWGGWGGASARAQGAAMATHTRSGRHHGRRPLH